MSEANENELIDEDIIHQLEETLGKDTLEKQLIHRRDSHPTTISPQISTVEEREKKASVAAAGKLPAIPGVTFSWKTYYTMIILYLKGIRLNCTFRTFHSPSKGPL